MHMRYGIAAALLCAADALAQSPLRAQDVDVHYSVVASESLPVESARQYAITRSPDRAVLIVAVRKTHADGREQSLAAKIEGRVVNAAGASEPLRLRELREGDTISYLAEPRIAPRDVLTFDMTVSAPGIATPIPLRFAQEFFPQRGVR